MLRMVEGSASLPLRTLLEPTLVQVISKSITAKIWKEVEDFLTQRNAITSDTVRELRISTSNAVALMPAVGLAPNKRPTTLHYGTTELRDIQVSSIIQEIEWTIAAAAKAIGVHAKHFRKLAIEELVSEGSIPRTWKATVDKAYLSTADEARATLINILNKGDIKTSEDLEKLVKAEVKLGSFKSI